MQGAGADDDFSRMNVGDLSAAFDPRADAALSLEQQLVNMGPVLKIEIGTRADLMGQIDGGNALAPAVDIVHRDGEIPVAEIAVLVAQILPALVVGGPDGGGGEARPLIRKQATQPHRPVLAVQRPVEIAVVLELLVIGQDVVPSPSRRAARFPVGEIARQAAIGAHAVDR